MRTRTRPFDDPAWADDEVATLRAVAASGGSRRDAAERLGVTYDAVDKKAAREGIAFARRIRRASPQQRRYAPPPRTVAPPKLPIVLGTCARCAAKRMINARDLCLDCHAPAGAGGVADLLQAHRAWTAGEARS